MLGAAATTAKIMEKLVSPNLSHSKTREFESGIGVGVKDSQGNMHHQGVNVWKYPDSVKSPEYWDQFNNLPGIQKQIIVGDQHGNFLKTLHTLISEGIVTMSKEDYEELVKIEKRHQAIMDEIRLMEAALEEHKNGKITLTTEKISEINNRKKEFLPKLKEDWKAFNTIIEDQKKLTHQRTDVTLKFIGDRVFDRQGNDAFMLKLGKQLQDKGLKQTELHSNHGDGFLDPEGSIIGGTSQCESYTSMKFYIDNNIIGNQTETDAFVKEMNQYYCSNLKLFDYNLEVDSNGKIIGMNILNHAVAGPSSLKALIDKYPQVFGGIVFKIDTIENICMTIDAVNEKFHDLVTTNLNLYKEIMANERDNIASRNEKLQENGESKIDERTLGNPTIAPFTYLVWNEQNNNGDVWPTVEGITTKTIHGHIGENSVYKEEEGFNVDGNAGKYRPLLLVTKTQMAKELPNADSLQNCKKSCIFVNSNGTADGLKLFYIDENAQAIELNIDENNKSKLFTAEYLSTLGGRLQTCKPLDAAYKSVLSENKCDTPENISYGTNPIVRAATFNSWKDYNELKPNLANAAKEALNDLKQAVDHIPKLKDRKSFDKIIKRASNLIEKDSMQEGQAIIEFINDVTQIVNESNQQPTSSKLSVDESKLPTSPPQSTSSTDTSKHINDNTNVLEENLSSKIQKVAMKVKSNSEHHGLFKDVKEWFHTLLVGMGVRDEHAKTTPTAKLADKITKHITKHVSTAGMFGRTASAEKNHSSDRAEPQSPTTIIAVK